MLGSSVLCHTTAVRTGFQRYIHAEQTQSFVIHTKWLSVRFFGVYITLCCWMLAEAADHSIKAVPQ